MGPGALTTVFLKKLTGKAGAGGRTKGQTMAMGVSYLSLGKSDQEIVFWLGREMKWNKNTPIIQVGSNHLLIMPLACYF